MTTRTLLLTLACGVAVLAGCQRDLTDREREEVRVWLLCDDCDGGERQRVASFGDRAVRTLHNALRDGPSATGRNNIEAQLRDLYGRLAPLPMAEATFVATYLENYVQTFQVRAALSLGDIGTRRAVDALETTAALDRAGTTPLPPLVRSAVQAGIGAALPPFSGSLSDSVVAAFDTVRVFRGTAAWDGDETVSLLGAPYPDDLLLLRAPDSLLFIAAAPPGTYPLVIVNESGGRVQVPLRITTQRYQGHDAATAPQIGTGPFPRTIFLSLAPAAIGDTMDLFRVEAPGGLTLRVQADWIGPGNVDLEARPCPGMIPPGTGTGATSGRPERLDLVLPGPGHECQLLLVALRGAPQAAELIRLTLSIP